MTKDAYFEMCEAMGSEPIESEIPIELDDFPPLTQTCFVIYQYLNDNWDTMGGQYMGKDYSIVFDLFDVYQVEKSEQVLALEFLQRMDSVRSAIVSEKLKEKTPQKK